MTWNTRERILLLWSFIAAPILITCLTLALAGTL